MLAEIVYLPKKKNYSKDRDKRAKVMFCGLLKQY